MLRTTSARGNRTTLYLNYEFVHSLFFRRPCFLFQTTYFQTPYFKRLYVPYK